MTDTAHLTPLQIATRRHLAADMLRPQTYGKMNGTTWRACSVGCLAHDIAPEWDYDDIAMGGHALVAEHYSYPEWLVHLQDQVFEGLPDGERGQWHVQLADAIAAKVRDWSVIRSAILAGVLRIALRYAGSSEGVVQLVIGLHERAIRGEVVAAEDWASARAAARMARAAARDDAAGEAAGSAAAASASVASVAWAAASAAEVEARASVAWAAAWAAEVEAYGEIRDAVLAAITAPA